MRKESEKWREGGMKWEGRGGGGQIWASDLLEGHIHGVVKICRLADSFGANASTIPV